MRSPPLGALLLPLFLVGCADAPAPAPAAAPAPKLKAVQVLSSSFSPTATAVATRPPAPTATPTRPPPTATNPAPTATATKPAPTATKAPSATPKAKPSPTPLQSFTDPLIVQIGLKSKLPVTAVQVLNAANDPDKLLGKPNGYPAKVSFQDPRIGNAHGFVELFADDAALKARLSYLQAQAKAGAIGPVAAGMQHKVIFRLPKGLSPAQLQSYQAAFGM